MTDRTTSIITISLVVILIIMVPFMYDKYRERKNCRNQVYILINESDLNSENKIKLYRAIIGRSSSPFSGESMCGWRDKLRQKSNISMDVLTEDPEEIWRDLVSGGGE